MIRAVPCLQFSLVNAEGCDIYAVPSPRMSSGFTGLISSGVASETLNPGNHCITQVARHEYLTLAPVGCAPERRPAIYTVPDAGPVRVVLTTNCILLSKRK